MRVYTKIIEDQLDTDRHALSEIDRPHRRPRVYPQRTSWRQTKTQANFKIFLHFKNYISDHHKKVNS